MNLATVPNSDPPGSSADTRIRLTPLETGLVALLAVSALINYVDRQAISVISTVLIKEFQLSDTDWGKVNMTFSISYVITAALGGIWVDRVGVRKALLLSTVVWSIAAAGHVLATDFWSLCFWRVMLAVGEGPGGASLLKGVRRVTPPRFRDMGTAIIGAGTLAGALLAPLLIVPLATKFGWRAAFLVTSSLGGLWLPFWLAIAQQKGANLDPVSQSVDAVSVSGPTPKPTLTWSSKGVWATAFCIFFSIPPSVFTLSFFPRFLEATYGLEMAQTKNLQWQPYLAMDLGQIAAGFLLIRMFRKGTSFLTARRIIMTTGFIGATMMTLMNFAPTLAWAMVWMDVSRFCFQFAYVGLLAYGISVVSENEAGRMNGFMNAIFGACSAVFNIVIGNVSDHFHHDYRPVIWLVGLIPIVGLSGWTILSSLHARHTGKDE